MKIAMAMGTDKDMNINMNMKISHCIASIFIIKWIHRFGIKKINVRSLYRFKIHGLELIHCFIASEFWSTVEKITDGFIALKLKEPNDGIAVTHYVLIITGCDIVGGGGISKK
jgi:hypothetical protein